jgi:hypothetical protein
VVGEAVRSAVEAGRQLSTREGLVMVRRGEVWRRWWRHDVPSNHAVQRTPGARILRDTGSAAGGAPGAADGERWADEM